ncbi:MAG: helix-turn-helix domain-containing protein [Patescibacteria group bacterium]|nr:helix-turn-helix domain-containing protein [Patescibacteria group bacterium]
MVTASMEPSEIADLRERLDLTQEQLADRLGVHRSAVAQWETGKTRPRGPAQILLGQLLAEAKSIEQKKSRQRS